MSDLNTDINSVDPDTLNDAEFAEYKTKMQEADGELPAETPKQPTEEAKDAKDPAAAEPDDDGDDDDASGNQESVPHGRFHRERERRKAIEAREAETNKRYALLEERTNQLLQLQIHSQQPRQEQQAPEPTYEERAAELRAAGDFVGLQELQDQQIRTLIEQNTRTTEEQAQRQRAVAFEGQVMNVVRQDFEAALKEDPSVQEAYDFMFASGVRQKMEIGGMTEAQAVAEMRRNEFEFFVDTLQKKQSPLRTMKRLAEMRGWKPAAAETQNNDPQAAAAEFERINKAKSAARSLSGSGSEARTGLPTPADIVNMSDSEFRAYKEKHGDDAMRLAMGA